ncbi:hypothetical protein STANM309S_04304 [Streptomyces tanashiensis]
MTWAVPVDAEGAPRYPRTTPVVHAPTPTDEPLGIPALLIASLPLDTARRHPAPGPLTDFLVQRAADAYAELLADWHPVTTATLDLVPGPLGKGPLDGALREAILDRLPRVAFLAPAAPSEELPALRPIEAEVAEGAGAETVDVLAEVFPTLLPAGLERRPELRTLGVGRVPLTEAIDRLAGVDRAPTWWWRLYDSLAGVDPDRLTGLPVPLAETAEGARIRTTIGPRQVLLPQDRTPADLTRLGLKVAHPEAAHPLLEKLGALPATPRAVLTTPQVRAAVAGSLDAGEIWDEDADALDAEELADTVLALVRDAELDPGEEPWLGALALPDEDGELPPAGELVLPGSPFAAVMREDELAFVDAELASRWGEQPLAACGVLANFALVRATDLVLDPDEVEPREGDYPEPDDAGLLDAVDVWCEDVLDRLPETPVPPVATEIVAVRDLDLVDDDAWPQALALLARPPLRDALTQPVRVLLPDGTTETVRSYTAWWLRDHPVLDGRRPAGLRAAGSDPLLAGLYDSADATGFEDEQVLRALGVRTSVAALLDEPGGAVELLTRLADPSREVTGVQLHALYTALADLDPEQVTLPDELRAVVDGTLVVVDASEALVADAPDLLPLAGDLPLLPVSPSRAADLADLFQVRRLSEAVAAEVTTVGEEHEVPPSVHALRAPRPPPRTSSTRNSTRAAPISTGAAPPTASSTPRPWRAWRPASPGRPASGRAASRWRPSWRTRRGRRSWRGTAGSTERPRRRSGLQVVAPPVQRAPRVPADHAVLLQAGAYSRRRRAPMGQVPLERGVEEACAGEGYAGKRRSTQRHASSRRAAPTAATPTAVHGIVTPTSFRAKKSWSQGTARTRRKAPAMAATRVRRHQV